MPEKPPTQVWEGTIDGQHHRVEVRGSVIRRITWLIDGDLAVEKRTADDRATVDGGERGKVKVIHSTLGAPRRATVFRAPEAKDLKRAAGIGGVDLTPEPSSKAAAYERRVLDHPTRYALFETVGSAGGVAIGILAAVVLGWLAKQIPWPSIDLPDIPWPDLPSIPWPDLPEIHLPGWVEDAADVLPLVFPVLLAFGFALLEIRRRRRHAARRATEASSNTAAGEISDSVPRKPEPPS